MNQSGSLTSEEVAVIFRRLRALKRSFGRKPNRNDMTAALIGACIVDGFNTEGQLLGALQKLEIPRGLTLAVLRHRTGADPKCHMWCLQADESYALLELAQTASG